ncbi:MAG: hypothetical protein R3E10_08620 [Gemmatimonadota bacterium]
MSSSIERDVRWLKAYALLSTVVLVLFATTGFRRSEAGRFETLDVERLNVLNPDGLPALVLAGFGNLPGPRMDGRELPRELSAGRTSAAGMIFFNERGDEVGGLTFHGSETSDGYAAGGHFSFDQFRQDQVVAMQYVDDGTSRRAGLNVWDRSTEVPLMDLVDLLQQARLGSEAERSQAQAALQARAASGELGAHRVFLGSADRTALLTLEDPQGRPRLRLAVGEDGQARIEFLDEQGEVTQRIPATR